MEHALIALSVVTRALGAQITRCYGASITQDAGAQRIREPRAADLLGEWHSQGKPRSTTSTRHSRGRASGLINHAPASAASERAKCPNLADATYLAPTRSRPVGASEPSQNTRRS
jgi:hypothetical protein